MLKQIKDTATRPGGFDITTYFEGQTHAFGLFRDRFGRVHRTLKVDMFGRWDGDKFVLMEDFHYDDGRSESRVWTVQKDSETSFTATSADSVGAAIGEIRGAEIRMKYTFCLKMKKHVLNVQFDDRLYQIDEERVVNTAVMSKWGIKLGEVLLFFRKSPQV